MRSTTPWKCSPSPMGYWMAIGRVWKRSEIIEITRSKFAPALSILLTKAKRGILYLSACLQTVSD